jgi:hypothetical protein
MKTLHSTARQAGGVEDARVKTNPVMPGEAKGVWYMMEKPTSRKVADWFTARGRPVSSEAILQWKRAGWPGTSIADVMKGAAAALANIIKVAPTLTGDIQAILAGALEPKVKAKSVQTSYAPSDRVGNMELAEAALRSVLVAATAVSERIRDIAVAVPTIRAPGDTDERLPPLLEDADSIAELMLAANTAIDAAVDGFCELAVLRAENAAAMPGPTGPRPSRH